MGSKEFNLIKEKEPSMANKKVKDRVDALIERMNTFIITTYGDGIKTALGYLPFVVHNDEVYVFPSTLAEHGTNLAKGANATVMFIEDEHTAAKLPARLRGIFEIEYEAVENDEVLDKMEVEIDGDYAIMRHLSDFTLYKITMKNGRYIQGFGAAYLQDENGDWKHNRPSVTTGN